MVAKKYKLTVPVTATDIRFYAPKDYDPNDAYEVNNKAVELLQPDGSKVVNGWKAGSPIQFILNADKSIAYVDVAPVSEGTSTVTVEPFVNIYSKTPAEIKQLTNLLPLNVASVENTGWSVGGSVAYQSGKSKYGNYSLKLTGTTGTAEITAQTSNSYRLVQNHIYYARYEGWQDTKAGSTVQIYWPVAEPSFGTVNIGPAGQWNMYSFRTSRTFANGSHPFRIDFDNNRQSGIMYADGMMLIDLTADFGSGNEPTKEWCDANIPFFGGTKTIAFGSNPNINALVSDGIYMYAGGGNGILYKIDMGSGETIDSLSIGGIVNDVTISDDKKVIAVATTEVIKIVNTQTFDFISFPVLNNGTSYMQPPYNSISVINDKATDYLFSFTSSKYGNNRSHNVVGSMDSASTMVEQGNYPDMEFSGQVTGNLRKVRSHKPANSKYNCYMYGGFQTSNVVARVTAENGQNVWQFTKHTGFPQALEVDKDDNVYSGAGDGMVYKLNGETGTEIWQYTYGSVVRAIFVDNGGYVYVTGQSGEIHKLTPEGKLIWKSNIYSGINRAIFVDNGGYVYSGGDSQVVNKARTPAVLYSQDGKPSEIMQAYKINNNYYIIP